MSAVVYDLEQIRERHLRESSPRGTALTGTRAPWPQGDKFPIVIGELLTFQRIGSILRMALQGQRRAFVDLCDELLDHEPHGFSVLSSRVHAVAGGRLEISPAELPDDAPESDKNIAKAMSDAVTRQLDNLRNFSEVLARMQWAIYDAIRCEELLWSRTYDPISAPGGWTLSGMQMVHSRRVGLPDSSSWDLYVQDVDYIGRSDSGLRIADYPAKFVVHAPQMRGGYVTREGLGRILVTYFAIKRMTMRVSAQDFERFVKPWLVAYFSTGFDGKPRVATEDDIATAREFASYASAGALAGATLPDSVRVELLNAVSKLSATEMLEYLDQSITKAVKSQTFTTQPGKYGSKGTNETGRSDQQALFRYDAKLLANTVRYQIVQPIVELNFPGADRWLLPKVAIHVDDRPELGEFMNAVDVGVRNNMPLDADEVGKLAGLPLVPNADNKPRRMALVSGVDPGRLDPTMTEPAAVQNSKAQMPMGEQPGDKTQEES